MHGWLNYSKIGVFGGLKNMKRLIPAFLMLIFITAPVYADDFQDALVAYQKQDYKVAIEKFIPLAEKGNPKAQFILGVLYVWDDKREDYYNEGHKDMDDEKAVKWFKLAANQGNVFAQHNLGVMYESRPYIQPKQYERREWFRPNLEEGDTVEMILLEPYYLQGMGIQRDHYKAVKWYELAAEQGIVSSQFNLGLIAWDKKEQVKWLLLAAEQGHDTAQYNLALMYIIGDGVLQDYVQAHKWFNILAANESEDALRKRENIAKKMTTEQIAEAQKLAREWMEEHEKE